MMSFFSKYIYSYDEIKSLLNTKAPLHTKLTLMDCGIGNTKNNASKVSATWWFRLFWISAFI